MFSFNRDDAKPHCVDTMPDLCGGVPGAQVCGGLHLMIQILNRVYCNKMLKSLDVTGVQPRFC